MPDNSKVMTSSAHVLVVDDEPDIRRELKEYLTRHNYRVSTADSGAAMRHILERQSAELNRGLDHEPDAHAASPGIRRRARNLGGVQLGRVALNRFFTSGI